MASLPPAILRNTSDCYGLIPPELPPHPRVFVTPAHIEFTRSHLSTCPWRRSALSILLERCRQIQDFSDDPQAPLTPAITQAFKNAGFYVMRNALAFHLTRKSHHYHEALRVLVALAEAYVRRPLTGHDCRAVGGGMYEQEFVSWLACAYDLLAAEGFGDADQRVLNAGLQAGIEVVEANRHSSCSNHNSWGFRANLSIAGAIGDRQRVMATLYGGHVKERGRYGFIHQLRHDLLADGIEWEHNLRHHFLTMATYADLADRGRNLGIDLWNRTFPASLENEGFDLHRDYGPPGDKALWTAFVAPLYQIFPNGEFPLLGDSRLSQIQGLRYWGIFYHLAYEAHPDSRLAWAIHQIELQSHTRRHPDLPAGLQTETADLDFVRLLQDEWPAGRFDLKEDASFGLTGLNQKGCSLFPTHGSALLRVDPDQIETPCTFLFWGPHSGGHQGPGALNLELYAGGHRITDAPWSRSFEDPLHLAWCRTTLAHNTVTVDETPMHPYDQPTESVWESDYWHHTVTDGELLGFYPNGDYKIVRACNDKVYPGVRLDRTVVAGRDYVLDLYRCLSADEHHYDWVFQCPALIHVPSGISSREEVFFAGTKRGYSQLRKLQGYRLPVQNGIELKWTDGPGDFGTHSMATAEGTVVTALTPEPDSENGFPGSDHYPLRAGSLLMLRCCGRSVAFATLFTFRPRNSLQLESLAGDAEGDLALALKGYDGTGQNWVFPINPLKPHWNA
jgi:hypothetical protein